MSGTVDPSPKGEARRSERFPALLTASIRRVRHGADNTVLTNISTHGCGFELRWAIPEGTKVLLQLEGLEPWRAHVVWFSEGRGGLAFERPLHPAVAARFRAGRRVGS